MTNIFTASGAVDPDIDPQTIPEGRRAQYLALAAAAQNVASAEADEKSANEAVAELVKALDRAHAALPKSTFLQEWRASRG